MDESRKAFERFLREEHLYTNEELAWEDGRNCYSIYAVHIAWKSWQASRETIEIKLDDKVMVEDEFDKGHNCAIDYCAEAIRAAGIKVKE
ncbi:TPA: hypothetical protein JG829_002422 [Enterobacter hormaechei subsp. steigerwaltii]|nr:hypothetical protein [Enterobacter hormaechei subsp. steigerwaltii]